MRRCLILACLFMSVSVFAQTSVIKTTATKSNNYGVTYFLPKTEFVVKAKVLKVTEKAGPYYKYAQKYLGAGNPVVKDQVYYILDGVTVGSHGIPDKEQAYLIEFKTKTVAPFACLTEEGLLCTINAEYRPEQPATVPAQNREEAGISAQSVFTEEYLQAGSVVKMADITAKQIYRLRESRTDLITGEAENIPRDGEAMKLVMQQLEAREKVLVELFQGTVVIEEQGYEVSLIPDGDTSNNILFRFSKHLGVVGSDDLSGSPVYINIKQINKTPEITDPKALEARAKLAINPKGIIYKVPGKAQVEVVYGTESVFSGEMLVAQFGETQVLAPNILEDKKTSVQIFFYPETGAIKQILGGS